LQSDQRETMLHGTQLNYVSNIGNEIPTHLQFSKMFDSFAFKSRATVLALFDKAQKGLSSSNQTISNNKH